MQSEYQTILNDIITDLLVKMGFEATVDIHLDDVEDLSFFCSVHVTKDQNFLIGQYGVNLAAIQHIVRVIARKRTGEKMNIIVDVNDYFAGKKTLLEKEAEKAVEEALQNNISVALRAMLPYERKIIHSFLASHASITTESIGKGDERKVIIKPRPTVENA